MIPEGWKIIYLEKIAKVQTGLAKGKKGLKNIVTLPYLRVANVQDGYLDLKEIKEIEVDESQVSRYLLQYEDILLTEGGDFDKLGRGTIWHCQIKPCLHQNHVFVVRTDRDKLNCYFFSQQISSFYGKAYFLSCAKQTTNLASINLTQLKEFPVLLPPLSEQRKIVEILTTWDKAIALLEQLITAKRKLKRGLMQRLLTGKKRFKEFESSDWKKGMICNLIKSLDAGTSVNSEDRRIKKDEVGILKTSAVTYGTFIPDEHKVILPEEVNRATINPRANRIIISRMNTPSLVGASVYISKDYPSLFLPDRLWQTEPKSDDFSMQWLSYVIASDMYRAKISDFATGTSNSMKNISKASLLAMNILIPSLEEQQKIASILSTADAEISNLEKQLAAYKQQKRALMQQLLTGKKRVKIEADVTV